MEKEKRDSDLAENTAFERAVGAAKRHLEGKAASLDPREQEMLKTFPPEDRVAVIVFARWCEGQSFKGGIRNKLAAKAAFIQAGRIFQAIYAPASEPKPPISGAQ